MSEQLNSSELNKESKDVPLMQGTQLDSEAHRDKLPEPELSTTRKEIQPEAKRKILTNDFFIGLGIALLIGIVTFNALPVISLILTPVGFLNFEAETMNVILISIGILYLVLNILVLIVLAIVRRGIFFGMLTGYALLFLVMGLLTAACFTMIYSAL
jgi:hypothetical protein